MNYNFDGKWPNPNAPGVPLDPDKNGWHWVSDTPTFWFSTDQMWHLYEGNVAPKTLVAWLWSYGGPCYKGSDMQRLKTAAIEVIWPMDSELIASCGPGYQEGDEVWLRVEAEKRIEEKLNEQV